jgi:predicted O-linked N-acetylglucosamine transferase (SPINDLY family)
MDYNIADKITDPIGQAEKFYTEKLLYLPKTFLCYGMDDGTEIHPPPFLKNGYITFGSFNNAQKYSNTILKIWGELFDRLKDARLIIRTVDAANEYAKEKLVKKFADNGIDIKRVRFLPAAHRGYYFKQYNEVDIILDTYPFNGATTTCDAFLMGKPIISLYGSRHVSRVGLSMLTNVGLADLAVADGKAYVNKAAELSLDTKRLVELSENLREVAKASPLFNIEEFKRDFEDIMYEAYKNHFN